MFRRCTYLETLQIIVNNSDLFLKNLLVVRFIRNNMFVYVCLWGRGKEEHISWESDACDLKR
jgi:hypothetical protein